MCYDFEGKKLPDAPPNIKGEIVDLVFDSIRPGDPMYGFVPFYYFYVQLNAQKNVGHIILKVGITPHVLFCAGHIGYGIDIPFRGHSYAYHACKTLAPFVKTLYDSVIITADPGNLPSIRTIEKLGATYLDLHPVPIGDPNYKKGVTRRHRWEWKP